jgi:hypothetical protein
MSNFSDLVPISSIPSLNKDVSSATEETMVDVLGSAQKPLTTSCQDERASPAVKQLLDTRKLSDHVRVTGIKPALDSLEAIFAQIKQANPELLPVLATEGMLCVRLRKPTSGQPSTKMSNHSWGTAIDFKLLGEEAPGNTGLNVPRWVALLVPHFNKAGWFSGIGFRDDMHFEASNELVRQWAQDGLLGEEPTSQRVEPVAARRNVG